MKCWKLVLFVLCFVAIQVGAEAKPGTLGDDDPYPIFCVDFSGAWHSDTGRTYRVEQKRCSWLRIKASSGEIGKSPTTTTIVPDNKARQHVGDQWSSVVRHRWNDLSQATAMYTYRTTFYADRKVEDVIVLEKATDELLLESTYTTIYPSDGAEPQKLYNQEVFRKAKGQVKK